MIRKRVCASRRRQLERQGCANGALAPNVLVSTCALDMQATRKLEQAADQLHLSGRSLHRVLRVALTIADLAGEPAVGLDHIGEALGLSNRSAGT